MSFICRQILGVNEKTLLTSYQVACRVAKAGKPHTVAENLILPAAVDMVKILFDTKETDELLEETTF